MGVIKEVDLEDFIAEPEHDGMLCFEPLLNINEFVIFLVAGLWDIEFDNFIIKVDDELF